MKKILFASTALIASAGAAAAEVEFNGYGRFGIGYAEDRSANPNVSDTIIVSRLRINIDAEAETDGGVQFGARVRLQADENAGNGEGNLAGLNAPRFHVAYGGLRVEVGNVAGAIDNLPGYYGFEPGLETFGNQYSAADYSFVGYSSNGDGENNEGEGTQNGVYARYAVGDFAVAASFDADPVAGADRMDVHVAYSFGNVTAALGYAETDNVANDDMTVLTLQSDFGPFSTVLLVGDESVNDITVDGAARSDTFYGVSASYELSAATSINFSYGDGSGDRDTENVAIGAIHDLGGGVSLRGGIGRITSYDAAGVETDQNKADFGVQFSF